MPRPLNTLPMDPRAAAFKAIYRKLKEDSVLNSIFGSNWSHVPTEMPTTSSLPYMRISAVAGPIAQGSATRHDVEINAKLEYAVNASGTATDDAWSHMINLYGQIEQAIDPFGDHTWIRNAIQAVEPRSVFRGIKIASQGFGSGFMPDINAITATCVVTISLQTPACRTAPVQESETP